MRSTLLFWQLMFRRNAGGSGIAAKTILKYTTAEPVAGNSGETGRGGETWKNSNM